MLSIKDNVRCTLYNDVPILHASVYFAVPMMILRLYLMPIIHVMSTCILLQISSYTSCKQLAIPV